jgi:hypothetical protein
MQIREQIAHLLLRESSRKRRHHALTRKHHAAHFRIVRRNPARQCSTLENPMQVRRNFLEIQVVLLVAMRAPARVQMFALCLLVRKLRCGMAPQKQKCRCHSGRKHRSPASAANSESIPSTQPDRTATSILTLLTVDPTSGPNSAILIP